MSVGGKQDELSSESKRRGQEHAPKTDDSSITVHLGTARLARSLHDKGKGSRLGAYYRLPRP